MKITGIKRNTSLLKDQDGACTEIINMRYKDEGWQSIQPGTLKANFAGLPTRDSKDIYFKHQVAPDNLIIWWRGYNGDLDIIDTGTGLVSGSPLANIQGVTKIAEYGIMLLVVSSGGITYFKFDKDTSSYVRLNKITHGRYTFSDTDRELFGKTFTPQNAANWIEEGTTKVLERRNALEKAGKTNGHVLFRLAFKTKDGMFMNYSPIYYRNIGYTDADTTAEAVPNVRTDGTYYYISWGNWASPTFKLDFTQEQFDTIASYSGFIESLCIFMSKPHYDWDITASGSGLIHVNDSGTDYYFYPHTEGIKEYFANNGSFFLIKEIPFLDLMSKSSVYGGTFTAETNTAVALPNPPPSFKTVQITKDDANGHFVFVEDTDYIIDYTAQKITANDVRTVTGESHSVKYIDTPDNEFIIKLNDKNLISCKVSLSDGTDVTNNFSFDFPNGTATLPGVAPSGSDIPESETFYFDYTAGMVNGLVYDATFGSPLSGNTDMGDVSLLETKLSLPVDNFTSHTYFSDIVYEYNSRLHFGGVKTLLGDIPNITMYDENPQGHLPDGYNTVQDDNNKSWTYHVFVTLETDDGEKKILTQLDKIGVFNDGTDDFSCLNQILTYPDQRARTLTIYGYDADYHTLMQTITLTPHSYLNLSYYVNPDSFVDKQVAFGTSPATVSKRVLKYNMLKLSLGTDVVNVKIKNTVTDSNRVQVSEVNNPFVYPAKNSYRIGRLTNKITALASQSIPVSTGQFGQYPLYVFTSEGIFAMQQGDTVLYRSIQPISLHSATGRCVEIEGGVLFSTEYGLFIISGAEIKEISIPVEGTPETFLNSIAEYNNVLIGLYPDAGDAVSTAGFNSFLQNSILAYEPVNREIYISVGTKHTYIYSLLYNVWYKSATPYERFLNIAGRVYGMNGVQLLELSTPDDLTDVNALIVTRPVKFGSDGLKKVTRAILRIIADIKTQSPNYLSFHLYGSLNGITWSLIQGKDISDFTKKEIILEMPRATARYFIFVIGLNSKIVRIESIDVDASPVDNNKQR
jgi:hypothetical protein